MRKTVSLPINNIHEKICVKDVLNFTDSELSSQFCARAKSRNQEKIAPYLRVLDLKTRDLIGHL